MPTEYSLLYRLRYQLNNIFSLNRTYFSLYQLLVPAVKLLSATRYSKKSPYCIGFYSHKFLKPNYVISKYYLQEEPLAVS